MRLRKRGKSQAVVELAITIPFIIVMLMTVVDFGMIYHCKLTTQRLALDAGQYLSGRDGSVSSSALTGHLYQMKPSWMTNPIQIEESDWTQYSPSGTPRQMKRITLRYDWPIFTFVLQSLLGKESISVTGTSDFSVS